MLEKMVFAPIFNQNSSRGKLHRLQLIDACPPVNPSEHAPKHRPGRLCNPNAPPQVRSPGLNHRQCFVRFEGWPCIYSAEPTPLNGRQHATSSPLTVLSVLTALTVVKGKLALNWRKARCGAAATSQRPPGPRTDGHGCSTITLLGS